MKSLALIAGFYLVGITTWGQSVFRIDSLPKQGTLLNKAWKWHLGDQPTWVKPDYPDASWDMIDPLQTLGQLTKLPQRGIGWLRIRLLVPPALRGQFVAMDIIQAGATEVFLNGQVIYRNGKISPQKHVERGDWPLNLPPVTFSQDSVQVLAVRYAFSREHLTKVPIPFFLLQLLSPDVATAKNIYLQKASRVDAVLIGIFLIMGILQLLLYATATNQPTNLYFGLFLLAQCLAHFFEMIGRHPSLTPDPLIFTNPILFFESQILFFLFFISVASHFYLLGIYRFFHQPKDVYYFLTVILNAATLPTFLMAPASYTPLVFLLGEYILSTILPYLAILRIGIRAINHKKQGSILFTISHTVLLLTFIFMGLGEIWPFFSFLAVNNNYFFLVSFLSLAVTVSLLLSQEQSATNKLLQKQLIELDTLSEQTLAQEQEKQQLLATQNERLEQQVETRTAELRASQVQLIQKEKLASLGELTAGIAHEIQNPLNFVNNFSEVSAELVDELKSELAKGDVAEANFIADDLVSNLQKINYHGGRASSIVEGMLEHSRTESGEKRSTDLNALADEYLKIAYHGLKAKHKYFHCELITDFDPTLKPIEVAPQEIGRVLLNLYNNAFYAVSERARQTNNPDYQPIVTVSTKPQGNRVEIKVLDNGTGIAEAVKAKIFQPFFTTKPTGEGTGLGLSLSYDIITKGHRGTLTVESQQGEETAFIIDLPIRS